MAGMHGLDLNADVGEIDPEIDSRILPHITSANVACGGHAGDAESMGRVAAVAVSHGAVIGAQVSYLDVAGFGRRRLDVDPALLADQLLAQILDLEVHATRADGVVSYVKPHGALYNVTADPADPRNLTHARSVVRAVAQASAALCRDLPIVGMPGSALLSQATEEGITAVPEAFADRGYLPNGQLVPRDRPGALLAGAEPVVERIRALVLEARIEAIDGSWLDAQDIRTVCLHSDTPGAPELAARIRDALPGLSISAFVDVKWT